ncbi:membrane-associated protease 1 [Anaerosinus massiliensis]|uniref:membrane-associated protease 1 n=1 Tax=Massilibacillus massiliensis TaxID=1806837 RepID=UPI000DA5F7CB|nr:membrane-associated protease 1 [Massilibacillus massiliensis]
MGYTLSVKGKDGDLFLDEDIINSANVDIATPNNSMAKSTNVVTTLFITGKLTHDSIIGISDKDTLKLFKWSLVTAQDTDAYRDVTVKVISAGRQFRTIHFPNAFIIDYSERYSSNAGMGEFSLVIRQKADKFTDVQAD